MVSSPPELTMRYVFLFLMCLMLLFMAVQYNDPDGLMWMGIYALPAVWCSLAALRQQAFERGVTRWALICSVLLSVAGVFWFWPLSPRFWTKDVWYNVETAREGLGMMIISGILLMILLTRCKRSQRLCAGGSSQT